MVFSANSFYFLVMGIYKRSILFSLLITLFLSPFQAMAANQKKSTKKGLTQKLSKQTNEELNKNDEVMACYNNAKAGREKQHGVVAVEFEVGLRSEVISVSVNQNQTTLSREVSNCILEALKNLQIPFKSNERNKKISAIFRF